MKLSKEELPQFYQRGTARPSHAEAGCLSPETIARSAAGEWSKVEKEQALDHLLSCSDCAQELRIARSLQPWAAQAVSVEAGLSTSQRFRRYFPDSRIISFPTMTALFLITILLSIWIVVLFRGNRRLAMDLRNASRQELEASRQLQIAGQRAKKLESEVGEMSRIADTLSQPQLNVPIIALDPQDPASGASGPAARTISVPSSTKFLNLILKMPAQPTFSDLALEIADPTNKVVWTGPGLKKNFFNTFTVALPCRLFPAGQYHLRLYGAHAETRTLVEHYAARLEYR